MTEKHSSRKRWGNMETWKHGNIPEVQGRLSMRRAFSAQAQAVGHARDDALQPCSQPCAHLAEKICSKRLSESLRHFASQAKTLPKRQGTLATRGAWGTLGTLGTFAAIFGCRRPKAQQLISKLLSMEERLKQRVYITSGAISRTACYTETSIKG